MPPRTTSVDARPGRAASFPLQGRRRLLRSAGGLLVAVAGQSLLSACGGSDAALRDEGGNELPTSPAPADGPRTTVVLQFPPDFAYGLDAVHVAVLGRAPGSDSFGFVDPTDGSFHATGASEAFALDADSMTVRAAALPIVDGAPALRIPPIESGRVYFAFGDGFAAMPSFGAGGPPNGPQNPVLYDKFELDTASNPNANITSVDFFGVPFRLTGIDRNTGAARSIGFDVPRQQVLTAFQDALREREAADGNGKVFVAAMVRGDDGRPVRILAPKAAGLTDWQGDSLAQQVANAQRLTHFWDRYVEVHCWRPGRQFRCYDKDLSASVYYGEVDASGERLWLYTDAGRTQRYRVPYLPRPSCPAGRPNYAPEGGQPSLYHNVDSARGDIDWGFLLAGNTGAAEGDGAHWHTDPVAMAIVMSICRGVMHQDDGCTAWLDRAGFYQGRGDGVSVPDQPIFWYASLLHALSIGNQAYAFSYDDVFGTDPSLYFPPGGTLTVAFAPV